MGSGTEEEKGEGYVERNRNMSTLIDTIRIIIEKEELTNIMSF